MSELINNNDNRAVIRWKLLTSASALALTVTVSSASLAKAEDSDRPQLWIELGGQYAMLDDGQQRYTPPFLSPAAAVPYPSTLPSPMAAQRLPGASLDWTSRISFEPNGSDWAFSASIRYGRSASSGHLQKILPAQLLSSYYHIYAPGADYVRSKAREDETHAILDFEAGKDVGLGMLGGKSVLSAGVRVAQFTSGLTASTNAGPDYQWPNPHDIFKGAAQAKHGFHGIGPAISWNASTPIAGNVDDGELTLDWGANAAFLFGRRTAAIHHQTSQCQQYFSHPCVGVYTTSGSAGRSRKATIPNVGGFVGVSMRYPNAKISLGYRADEFFGAMDGGFASAKNFNLGFNGPFASISVGLGD